MSENNGGSIVGGFLLGAAVGAGLALIFAPMAGDETRRHIGETARRLKKVSMQKMGNVKGMIESSAGNVGAAVAAGKEALGRDGTESPIATKRT